MTEPVGADMSCHCLTETKCVNDSQNAKNIISDFDWFLAGRILNSCHIIESSEPCFIPAANSLSTFSYLFSKKSFVPAVKTSHKRISINFTVEWHDVMTHFKIAYFAQ